MSGKPNDPLSVLLTDTNGALRRAAEILQLAVDGIPPLHEQVAQLVYVRQQAQSVVSVASDVHLLLNNQRFQNVVGLCRIAFESRISMYAAMRVPEFTAQKYLATAKGNVEELEEIIKNGVKSSSFQLELENHRRLLRQMRQDFAGVEERKWWPFSKVANAAGLKADYEAHYSLLSKATHNTLTGLAAKDAPRILVSSILRLLHDTIEACACLVFFRQRDDGKPQPLTKHWKELIESIESLQGEYENLSDRLNALLGAEFGTA